MSWVKTESRRLHSCLFLRWVECRNDGTSAQGIGRTFQEQLGLGLRIVGGAIAKFLTEVSLMGMIPTEEESKWRKNAKSF